MSYDIFLESIDIILLQSPGHHAFFDVHESHIRLVEAGNEAPIAAQLDFASADDCRMRTRQTGEMSYVKHDAPSESATSGVSVCESIRGL